MIESAREQPRGRLRPRADGSAGSSGFAEKAARLLVLVLRTFALTAATYAIILVGYQAGKWHAFDGAHLLTMTAIDQAVPFLPWTVWLYGTVTYATLVAYAVTTTTSERTRLGLTLITSSAVCAIVFAAYPTTYPRDLFPLPQGSGASIKELAELRLSDDPSNCLPSLHVALATAIALFLVERGRTSIVRFAAVPWAVIVYVATLTTKQHYVVDIPTGAAVGAGAYFLCAWAARQRPLWQTAQHPLALKTDADKATVKTLLANVRGHQWSLGDLDLEAPGPPLDPVMVRLLNHVIYIEEIAANNFDILARATPDEDVRELYRLFEDEEHRHAEGLRRILLARGGWIERPGLGNALVLDQQTTLDPSSHADAVLVAISNPVFETFLDAGTIPFLKSHPALASEAFDEFVRRVTKDEAAHIGLNWILTRQVATGPIRIGYMLNPAIYRGVIAVPFMSLDVYAVAHRLGFEFKSLLPPFKKLWKLHRKYEELGRFPMWNVFRLFVACGYVATNVTATMARWRILFIRFWTTFSRVTDVFAWVFFGRRLLDTLGLPGAPLLPKRVTRSA